MAREQFIRNLRQALSLAAPSVEADTAHLNPAEMARVVASADSWLTPRTIEGFDADDFEDVGQNARRRLTAAVDRFTDIAASPSAASAGSKGPKEAWDKLQEIVALIQPSVQSEWANQVAALVQDATDWCEQREWIAKTKSKRLKDKLIGEYDVHQLHFYDGRNHLLLDPVARFAPGTSGLIDIVRLPDFESMMVAKLGDSWYVRPEHGQGRRKKWSKEAFVEAVQRLSDQG